MPPNALRVACQTAARDQRPARDEHLQHDHLERGVADDADHPGHLAVEHQRQVPQDAHGREHRPGGEEPVATQQDGAANAVQPASSPMPTITSMTTNATGTSGQCASWAAVGSAAPNQWFTTTSTTCTAIGVRTARRTPRRRGPPAQPAAPGEELVASLAGGDDERRHQRAQRHVVGVRAEAQRGGDEAAPAEHAGEGGERGDRIGPDEADECRHGVLQGVVRFRSEPLAALPRRAPRIGRRTRPRAAPGPGSRRRSHSPDRRPGRRGGPRVSAT